MSLSVLDDPAPARDPRALVDAIIAERAPRLRRHKALWAVLRRVIFPVLGYRKAIEMIEAVRHMSADECFAWGDDYLRLSVEAQGLENVPEAGPVLIIANHPGGIADGNALWRALKARRPDMMFFANRDALRICPGLSERIIPVEWRQHELSRQRARETLKSAMNAFREGRCVVIFPGGRMADWSWSRRALVEPAWSATGVSIARRFNAPIVPLGVTQAMPLAYYAMAQIHEELRDVTLFHGLLNQRGAYYRLTFGEPMLARDISGSESEATTMLKARCNALAWGR